MQLIVDGVDIFSLIKNSLVEYSGLGFGILGFYIGAMFYKYFFIGKKYYEGTNIFKKAKENEIKKLKSEIEFLKKNISDILKEKQEIHKKSKDRIELDFEKKLPSKEKVYEIVKNIYRDLQETTTKKTFNLTEAVFMMRNMDEYNFFTKESGRIMFEKK